MELTHVKNIYSIIANKFDITRKDRIWKNVEIFLKSNIDINKPSKLLDYGCGNGKYIPYFMNHYDYHASDNCSEFIEMINTRYPTIKTNLCDVCQNNYPNDYFDVIISIAVIHHLSSEEKRISMLKEISRILKSNGKCLITAWTSDIEYGIEVDDKQIKCSKLFKKAKKINDNNDYLIPWNNGKNTYYRFYHLFKVNKFNKLVGKIDNLIIEKVYYEMNNYCVIVKKL